MVNRVHQVLRGISLTGGGLIATQTRLAGNRPLPVIVGVVAYLRRSPCIRAAVVCDHERAVHCAKVDR